MAARHGPPLPPRLSSPRPNSPYSAPLLSADDPRRSSTQSLIPPVESQDEGKRTLLLIYIHGYMGTETSFKSFPAHVHNLVTITLSESHVIHTKIYPRYAARKTILEVAENFSRWLAPHENDNTDVVLLSHSMGGLLAAEVELIPAIAAQPGHTFRHRILGVVHFDVPFLGLHPGVVSTGLGSIFRPGGQPDEASVDPDSGSLAATSSLSVDEHTSQGSNQSGIPHRQDTLFSSPLDPNFNPRFANDVILPVRKGWGNVMHFMNKHSGNLRKATKQLVKSHVEFGSSMYDYSGLRLRYMKVRALEDEDATIRQRLAHVPMVPARIRFVNYYTASTGRKKKERSRSRSRSPYGEHLESTTSLGGTLRSKNMSTSSLSTRSGLPSPRISIDEHIGDSVVHRGDIDFASELSPLEEASPVQLKSTPNALIAERKEESRSAEDEANPQPDKKIAVQMPNLPPLPPPPVEPVPLDLTPYPDEEVQRLVRREHDRQVKAYKQALKDREATIKDRQALEDKLRKLAIKESLKMRKEENTDTPKPDTRADKISESAEPQPLEQTDSKTDPSLLTITSHSSTTNESRATDTAEGNPPKQKKDRKFCVLPQKIDGERDPLWVRVFMPGHDEVSAHTSLFIVSPGVDTYERLVGDVAGRVEEWVRDDMTRRVVEGYDA